MEVIYGFNAVREAHAAARRGMHEILVAREHGLEKIRTLFAGIPLNMLPKDELDRITKTRNHQGIAARVDNYPYTTLQEAAARDVLVLLDSVEDPQNLGAIIRSAYALAGAGLVIPEHRSASVTPAVVKVSAGASEHARIARVQNLRNACGELKGMGFWLVGLDAGAAQELGSVSHFDRLALVLGGEDAGIRPVVTGELDLRVRIPMQGAFNSLNVAQSAAIALYELCARTPEGRGKR